MLKTIALLAALTALPANAILIEIGGEAWSLESTVLNPVNEQDDADEMLMRSQPWWGDAQLAYDFADAVRDSIGLPGLSVHSACGSVCFSPLFAYEFEGLGPNDPLVTRLDDAICPYFHCRRHSSTVWGMASFHSSSTGEFIEVREQSAPTTYIQTFAVATRVSVPEPGTLSLFAVGVLGALAARRRRPGAMGSPSR